MAEEPSGAATLLLCGDVMIGRGVDQILPHPGDPTLFEPYVRDARDYVALAEHESGPIPRRVEPDYVWGEALAELDRLAPDLRIVNLETSVAADGRPWPGKTIHYRVHPRNAGCLGAARLDACTLANNHALDWGREGLGETLETLDAHGIRHPGAGRDLDEASSPAILSLPAGGRVLLFALGAGDSGIPPEWAATRHRSGLWVAEEVGGALADHVASRVSAWRRPGDLVVLSIHWGPNWGFEIPVEHRRLAHALVEHAAVDVVYGHSSHHVKGIEVVGERLVLYGCGDLLDDYEGIGGRGRFRSELGLLYLPTLDIDSGRLIGLELVPTRVRRMQVCRARGGDAEWLKNRLTAEGAKRSLGTRVVAAGGGNLALRWPGEPA